MDKFQLVMLKNRKFYKTLFYFHCLNYHVKINPVWKRGRFLDKMITDTDRKKNWHYNILNNKAKARNVFENVSRPNRRQSVLNSLFIKNISDVISTGEIEPKILNYGIEITGVKISPCCKILNVFWQVPPRNFDDTDDIANLLNIAAPKVRAELISRNLMGRVPMIYFLRDNTNARVAAVEEAFSKLDLLSEPASTVVPDDSFTEDIFKFGEKGKKYRTKKEATATTLENEPNSTAPPTCPQNPLDMKTNVFGLDHQMMMDKVIAIKKKTKLQQQSAVITKDMLEKGDLFSNIPGVCFEPDTNREKIMKEFQLGRKLLMQKKNVVKITDNDYSEENYEGTELEENFDDEDYEDVDDYDDRR